MLSALHGFRAEHLDEARRLLEISVAGLAAERAGGEHLTSMAEQVSGMFASVEDPQGFASARCAFSPGDCHRGRESHPRLDRRDGDAAVLRAIARADVIGNAEDLRSLALLHRSIYHAIRSRDAERARREMAQHLRAACGAARSPALRLAGRGLVRDVQFIEQAPGPRGSPQRPHGEAAGAFARGDAAGPPTAKVESARSRSAPWQ